MKIAIDIDENVFTRLFDNGTEDYQIVNDDLFAIAKSIRNGKPLDTVLDEIRAEIEQEIEQVKFARSVFRYEEIDAVKAEQCTGSIFAYRNVIKFITDNYKKESEEK